MSSQSGVSQFLTDEERDRLLSFLGFGNPKAPIVFLGMEEGLTETPDYPLLNQLKDRAKLPQVVGLRESAVHPDKYLSGSSPPIQKTWSALICVLLALDRKRNPTNDDIRFFQSRQLGSPNGNAQLLELLPLPARNVASWSPYDNYFPDFPTREAYVSIMRPRRVKAIREHLSYGPRLVVAYGATYWPTYKQIFPEIATWKKTGVFQHGAGGNTSVVLMPHPVAREMNGNRDRLCELAVEHAKPR